MIDTTIKLISRQRTQDESGIWRDSGETAREVFARVENVSRAEFFAAGQTGHRPDYCFKLFPAEYEGETVCEYDGARYAIYRTYDVPGTDELELYVQREAGVHNGAKDGA